MPKPARTDVDPLPEGSQLMPSRGAMFFSDGFECHGSPTVRLASVTLRRLDSLPLTSVGVVMNSYLSPRLSDRFERARMSSCAKKPKSHCF